MLFPWHYPLPPALPIFSHLLSHRFLIFKGKYLIKISHLCLSIPKSLSVCVPVSAVCFCVCLCVYLSASLSPFSDLSISLCVCFFASVSLTPVSLSVCLSLPPSANHLLVDYIVNYSLLYGASLMKVDW